MSDGRSPGVRSGLRLSLLNTVIAGIVQFAVITVLARLLTPAQYGVYALCSAIAALSAVFVTNVVERMLVVTAPAGDGRDETLTIMLLCAFASLVAVLACLGLDRAGLARIDIGVLALICGSSVLGAAAIAPRVALRRQIRFGPIVVAESGGLLMGQGIAAIALALAGWGPYALAAGACVQSAVVALLLSRVRTAPIAVPTCAGIGALVRASRGLAGNAAVEIANGQVASLVLAARLGDASLGLFNRSYSLVQMPIQLLVASLGRVMVSALFAVSDDRDRLRATARALVRAASMVAAPVAGGIAGAGHAFVLFAFGPEWLAAATILPWLALAGWATMMGTVFGVVAEAMRAFAARTRAQVFTTTLLVLLSIGGAGWGLEGAVAGIAVACGLFLLMFARLAARLLALPVPVVLTWLAPGIVVALPSCATSYLIGRLVPTAAAPLLALQIAACGLVDGALLLLLFPGLALQIAEGAAPAALRLIPPLTRRLRHAAAARGA